jgi:hypothetical protein
MSLRGAFAATKQSPQKSEFAPPPKYNSGILEEKADSEESTPHHEVISMMLQCGIRRNYVCQTIKAAPPLGMSHPAVGHRAVHGGMLLATAGASAGA